MRISASALLFRRRRQISSISSALLPVAQTMNIYPNFSSYKRFASANASSTESSARLHARLLAVRPFSRLRRLFRRGFLRADFRMRGKSFEPICGRRDFARFAPLVRTMRSHRQKDAPQSSFAPSGVSRSNPEIRLPPNLARRVV